MKTVIIVQARMTSTRLPGKVLKTVLGKPLLEYQIERLRRASLADEIVIATTINGMEDSIVDLCKTLGIAFFRGAEENVLSRYHGAAKQFQADVVVRVTSDCPVIDPKVVNRVIRHYLDGKDCYDYVSNGLEDSYPRGMDTEVFSFAVLDEAFREAKAKCDLEHVTPFVYTQPERYRLGNVAYKADESHHRWTVDTPQDFELISNFIETLYPVDPFFSMEDMLQLIAQHPDWYQINGAIRQKKYDE